MATINQLTDAVAALDGEQRSKVVNAIIATLSKDERADLANRICLEAFNLTPRARSIGADPVSQAGLAFLDAVGKVGAEAFDIQRCITAFEATGASEHTPEGEAMLETLRELRDGLTQVLAGLRREIDALKASRIRGHN